MDRALVLISGQGGLGKTSLASFLSDSNEQIEFTSVDGYLEPRDLRPKFSEGDLLVPYDQVLADLETFLSGGEIKLRRYDHAKGIPDTSDRMISHTTRILVVEGGLVGCEVNRNGVALSILFRSELGEYIKHRSKVDQFRGHSDIGQSERIEQYTKAWKEHEHSLLQNADIVVLVDPEDSSTSMKRII